MSSRKLLQQVFGLTLAVLLLAGCGGAPAQPPGTVTGKVMYAADISNTTIAIPLPNVMVVLCQVPAEGLPEGPTVSATNWEAEHICTLQGTPTGLTDADGVFTLDGVPSATYLVMFHMFPDELEGVDWDGIALIEARLNEIDIVVAPSGELGFWEEGGPAIALVNWSAAKGMTVSKGNVCSNKFGFCFSIRDERLNPVIEVVSNETVMINLTTHFKPME